jgi:hypothetical protein
MQPQIPDGREGVTDSGLLPKAYTQKYLSTKCSTMRSSVNILLTISLK